VETEVTGIGRSRIFAPQGRRIRKKRPVDRPKVYHAMNGVRGIAAIAVLLYHAGPLVGFAVPAGYMAVDLFFLLSGFVIAHAYEARLKAGFGARRFMLLRLKRFYPLYALGTAIGAAWMAAEMVFQPPALLTLPEWGVAVTLGALFLPAFLGGDLFPLNVPAWSLFFELIANAAYGVFHGISAWGLGIAILVFLALLVFTLSRVQNMLAVDYFFARTFFSFPLGILIYRLRDRIPRWSLPALVPVAIACAPLFLGVTHPAWFMAAAVIIFPLGIALAVRAAPSHFDAAFEFVGTISFPLYAVHLPLIMMARALNTRGIVPTAVIGCATVAGSILIAWLLARYFDPSAKAWIDRATSAGRAAPR
jgi:peptidoglycan/LPS O-acetylase OafA/YrhL